MQVGGRRLHELAREGIEVEREARPVTVHRFDVEPTPDPLVYRIEVQCSSGTYVRTLAADLGHLLGGGAHLRDLRRTAIGSFTEAEAAPPDAAELLPPAEALRDYERIVVDEDDRGADPPRAAPRPPSPGRRRGRCWRPTAPCSRSTTRIPMARRPPSSSPAPDG